METPTVRTSGLSLRLERTALDVRVGELAAAMGVPPARISVVENSARVTERMAKRYRDALATFQTVPTPEEVA